MAADLHIHVCTPDITEETFRCFFSSSLGSKWFKGFGTDEVCLEKKREKDHYRLMCEQFRREFPQYEGKTVLDMGDDGKKRWEQLYKEHSSKYPMTCSHWEAIMNAPNIWVGEVSWLKAALFEDPEKFVPEPIGEIAGIIGEGCKITKTLIKKIEKAMSLPNTTGYSLANAEDILKFLNEHIGKKCLTVSW